MNPTQDPTTIQHFLSLPKRLGELAAIQPATQPRAVDVGSRLGAIVAHLKGKRVRSEEARDTLNRNLLVKNV
jgi:hypothetical protein